MQTSSIRPFSASLFVFFCLPILICSAEPSVTFEAGTPAGWDFHELDADIARNNTIDWGDLSIIAQHWLASGCEAANQWCGQADINGSTGVDLVDYALLSKDWSKQSAKDVLLQTIYGTAQDSAGNITANLSRVVQKDKGLAMAFNVVANTTLDKAIFKCFGNNGTWRPEEKLRIRLFNVTGKGYLNYNHSGITKAEPGGGNPAIFDILAITPKPIPSDFYHFELGDGRQYADMIINFDNLQLTAGDYFMTFDVDSSSPSNTWGSFVRSGSATVSDNMGKYPDGTALPKRAVVTTNTVSGNTYYYQLETTSSTSYTPYSYLFAFQITLANLPPVVQAGTDQIILNPNNIANLAGMASDDGFPDPPGILTTTWSKVSGPGTVTFDNAYALNTTAEFSELGTYVLRLTASDSVLSVYGDVTITYVQNEAPVVDVGIDRTIGVVDVSALSGMVTDDGYPPPGVLSFQWTKQSGPGTVTFGSPNAVTTTVTFSATGIYVLRLTASDGDLAGYDELTVTVVEGSVNNPPYVNAGPDRMTAEPVNTVALDAAVTDDGLPNPPGVVTTTWTKQSGPGPVTFGNIYAVDTTATFSVYGTYVLRLTASDSILSSYDEVTVIYTPPDEAPVVDAGRNRIIAYPINFVNLDGTVTDDGLPNPPGIVTTQWTKQSGPGTVTFGNASAVDTTATFSAYGTYVLRLTANDGILSSYDEMTVIYYEVLPPNQPPVVYAGIDKQFHLPAMAQLYGTVTDDNLPDPPGTTTTLWTQQSGPATATITNANALIATVSFPQAGIYVFRLTASDTDLSGYDEVTMTVLPPVDEMVYHVTNLANSGAGSLRDCVALANTDGVRSRIVFDVGGTINLTSIISLTDPNTTICGTTAPSPGITIDCGKVCSAFSVKASDGSFGHRFCNLHIKNTKTNSDGIALSGGQTKVTIERCTFTYCRDEGVGMSNAYGNIIAFSRFDNCGSQPGDDSGGSDGRGILVTGGSAVVVGCSVYQCCRGITLNTDGFMDLRHNLLEESWSNLSGTGFTNAGGSHCYSNVINCVANNHPFSGFLFRNYCKFYRSGNSGTGNGAAWGGTVPPEYWLEYPQAGTVERFSPITDAEGDYIPMPQWLQENLTTPSHRTEVGMGTGLCQCVLAR